MSLEQPPSRFALGGEEYEEIEKAFQAGVGLNLLEITYGSDKVEAFLSRPKADFHLESTELPENYDAA